MASRRQTIWWVAGALVALVAVFAITGFFMVPRIVRDRLVRTLAGTLHRPVAVGPIRVNPFALSVTIDSLRVADRGGARLLAWDQLYINLKLISVLRRELDFAQVRIVRPYARFVIRADGSLNVSDIVDSMQTAPPAKPAGGRPPGPPPVVSIDGFTIDGGRIDVLDSANARAFATTIGPFRIDLTDFVTRRDNNSQYSFAGRTESGESFAWAGTVGIDPLHSAGHFSLDSVKLNKYEPLYERTVSFDVPRGVAGVKANYEVSLAPQGRKALLSGAELRVGDLALVERGQPDTALAMRELAITNISIDAIARRAVIGEVASRGGVLNVVRGRDSAINVMRMAGTGRAIRSAVPPPRILPQAAPVTPNLAAAPAPPQHWLITRVAADSFAVNFTDSTTVKPVRLALRSVAVTLDSLASDSSTQSRLRASANWGQQGSLAADGTVQIWHRRGDLSLTTKNLSLVPFDAYGPPRVNLLITDGRLDVTAKVRFDMSDSLRPVYGAKGDLRVDRLATVDGQDHEPFVTLSAFRMTDVDYASRGPTLSIKEIRLDDPAINLRIRQDGSASLRTVFPRPGVDSAAKDSSPFADSTVSPDSSQRADSGVRVASAARPDSGVQPDSSAGTKAGTSSVARTDSGSPPQTQVAQAGKAVSNSAKVTAPGPPQSSMRVQIGSVVVSNGTVQFDDRSVEPAAAIGLTKIDAVTGRLSSDSIGTGTLDLTASVDNVAPLKINGRYNPLSAKDGSDLTVSIQSMELIPVGPYFGEYLGYLVAKGKMRVEMQYRLVGRRLKSENKLTLDEFEFGDKTSSPKATKLPVKLGFAVMRDRNGQIVFDVPIEGNVDDPNFRLGRVIWRAIGDVLRSLVTAPFKLLGGLFGGGKADLSYVEFAAGAAAPAPAETKKLDLLAKSLYERPALKLAIAGAVDTTADAAGLKATKLDAELRLLKWTALKAKEANPPPADSITLTPEDRPTWIAAQFEAAFPRDSAVMAAKKSKSKLPPYPTAVMESRLLGTINVSADDLRLLANARAKSCLDYFLTTPSNKVEPGRVFLTEGGLKTDGAKVEFVLQ